MNEIVPHFQEKVEALLDDWRGQDEMFFHSRSMQTIAWHFGKVRSLEVASAEIRTGERTKFMAAAAKGYGIELRRLQEAKAVYKRYYKPSDSLQETCERAFQDAGGYSKAVAKLSPPKPEKEVEEKLICGHCPLHCKHESNKG
jgi:hypothetical protein